MPLKRGDSDRRDQSPKRKTSTVSAEQSFTHRIAKRARIFKRSTTSPNTIIKTACAISDPFKQLSISNILPCAKLTDICLTFTTGATTSSGDIDWMFHAVEHNLCDWYEESIMTWNAEEKRKEMQHAKHHILMASHAQYGGRIAFLCYRWVVEHRQPTLYVYELFVEERMRGKGIAVALMKYAELLATKLSVDLVMLTVFTKNAAAMSLYREKLRFTIDSDSPSMFGHDVGYEILCKKLPSDS